MKKETTTEKPHYLQHRKRLKERFSIAPHAATDAEVVELLLGYVIRGRDVKPQAKEILSISKKLCNIFESNISSVKGVGPEVHLFFTIIQEFIHRSEYQQMEGTPLLLTKTDAVYKFLKHKIANNAKETFIIIFLDTKNRLKGHHVVREGFINSVQISARDIIEQSIHHNAVGVIISHNHPSGDCTPSDKDLSVTKQICHALQFTGVTLIDHMIVSPMEYYSMSVHGYINEFYDDVKKDHTK